jgi:hypothetical protein
MNSNKMTHTLSKYNQVKIQLREIQLGQKAAGFGGRIGYHTGYSSLA